MCDLAFGVFFTLCMHVRRDFEICALFPGEQFVRGVWPWFEVAGSAVMCSDLVMDALSFDAPSPDNAGRLCKWLSIEQKASQCDRRSDGRRVQVREAAWRGPRPP